MGHMLLNAASRDQELMSETGASAPDQPVTMVREPLEV